MVIYPKDFQSPPVDILKTQIIGCMLDILDQNLGERGVTKESTN